MFRKALISGCFAFALMTSTLLAQAPGFLGIRAQKGESLDQCAIIEQLAPGGPGERAGLAPGDVISSINGALVNCAAIQRGSPLVPQVKAGDRVVFAVLRSGRNLEITVQAEAFPAEVAQAQQERARQEAGREVFQRLVRTQEVFTVILLKGGGFELAGNMTDQELKDLHYYFEKGPEARMFPLEIKTDRQDMYVRFNRDKGGVQYEFVDSSKPLEPAKP